MTTSQSYAQIERPHAASVEDVLQAAESEPGGLSVEDAQRRLTETGPNSLPDAERDPAWKRFLKHFHDVLIYVLLVAAVVTAVMQHWVDTAVILAVVILNAVIGFVQEGRAEAALEGIKTMLSAHTRVRRGGEWVDAAAPDLVPGDVIRLTAGDRVPADARLLEATRLQVEEAALTGESVPASKSTEPVDADAGVGDRSSMVFSGTLVTSGTGIGVVTGTGTHTEIGRITTMLAEVESIETPLTRQMAQFGKMLSLIVIVMAVALLGIGWLVHRHDWTELILAAIGFAVAAIPEGLPAILTITLARGVRIMAQRKAITRRLPAVETLGSVTVVCSDKTGTLTTNEMTVRRVVTIDGRFDVAGTGYAPDGEVTQGEARVELADHPGLRGAVRVAALANDARVRQDEDRWTLSGEPTEGALRTLGLKLGIGEGEREGAERLAEVPFDSANKYMATLHRLADGPTLILLKGAPDRLLERCDRQGVDADADTPLDPAHWEAEIEDLGGQGLRVLAAAVKDGSGRDQLEQSDVDEGGFVFLGLFGIIDPPRPEAIDAIATCHRAGIDVKMITGDHAGTAAAIADQMGIGDGSPPVTGGELEHADDEELRELVGRTSVFARTSPEHKLRLVTALQANGEVAAMTGDGVNDAPALKRADVGVAMGVKGTEATKESADIVLADDNFSTIERAIEEGRTIYDNLRKAIVFALPTNGGQALVILVAVVMGWTLPLTPVQILWVNMVTTVTLALALAFEPAEPGLMDRPPHEPGRAMLDREFVWRIGFISVLIGAATVAVFQWTRLSSADIELARTIAVNTLVAAQGFYLISARRLHSSSLSAQIVRTNPVAWACLGLLVLIQLMYVYAPFMHTLFESRPMTASHWIVPVLVGVAVFLLAEAEKAVSRRLARRH